LWVLKCGHTASKIAKIGIFLTFAQKGYTDYTPLSDIVQNLTVLALKCGPTAAKMAKNQFTAIFGINLSLWKNFGVHRKS